MVSSNERGSLVHSKRLSSVGPGRFSGHDIVYEPSGMDLATKLHYLRMIYYFPSQAFEGLTTRKIKEPMFTWFNHYNVTAGRFRRSESGRPIIKCNDCGVRMIEAQCEKTLDEWLEMKDSDSALERLLFSEQIIGPELSFSPLVYLQYTKFKCGGMAVGLSWAHVLGDAFSAAEFMNNLGRILAGKEPKISTQPKAKTQTIESPKQLIEDPLAVQQIGPVEDNWITVNNCKLETFSFHVTLDRLTKLSDKNGTEIPPFESLSAMIWKIIAKIRYDHEPKIVTICRKDATKKEVGTLSNNSQVVSVVEVDFSIGKASHGELAAMLKNQAKDERKKIEDAMERAKGLADFVLYGANLTFVDLEEAKFYEFEYSGINPVSASCMIDGVGDNGAVFVLPGPKTGGARIVTVVLPEQEVEEFKSELKEWLA
ncbi:OLC1v1018986C2 [Oldenlandia corymbosa var. corymbosa]|nr:OLC1v1018986C2 [Oldenlandia corymbosa var. corymbosa]